ncbi:RNA 2',3'-cyclic phosphodiesterase, partial [Candidatus Micrarchaeota archaeon CG11_big_fil_rev_8_21_14_0_20_47_5]
ITVARVKARVDLSEFFEKNKKAEFGEFLVNAFTLKKSTLSSQGALYENA